MSQDKQIKKRSMGFEIADEGLQDQTTVKFESFAPPTGSRKYLATSKHMLPILYKGSIIYIGETTHVEIDFEALGYEPKIQFLKALKQKQIIEVGE